MEKTPSLLFAGIHFDRKRFAKDFARFKSNDEKEDVYAPEDSEAHLNVVKGGNKEKKRKRNLKDSGEVVEAFNVFKNSKSLKTEHATSSKVDDNARQRNQLEKLIEQDFIFRKKHGIHISGHNVPSPLRSFEELKLRGRECFACAPTGSGKTLAFLLPMLMKIKRGAKDGVKGLILCPTRELAAQITRECKKLVKGKKFYIKLMTKELCRNGDFETLKCDILISTPLRIHFAVSKRKLDLSRVEYFVLDESDKLFELGFVEQIDSVIKACSNPSIKRSLFSATLPDSVEELARTIMHDAVRVVVGRKNSASALVEQKLLFAGSEKENCLLFDKVLQRSGRLDSNWLGFLSFCPIASKEVDMLATREDWRWGTAIMGAMRA
ncbi:hypothetical protein HPP92_008410 [Vanilla planifolia]|uniref:RNA helicase n=1 Tax=Vanilla planifolia TaxID=51239 RepID=A0A835V5Z7_VANPL|nr:hypothetical protein HPP92_008410 [Vanilla planifolia]